MAQIQQLNQTEAKTAVSPETDGSFKFMLISNIEESSLKERLGFMMQDIIQQGDKLAKHMDIRDMKHYRQLIKNFMNEIVSRSHKFSRENFLDRPA